MGREGIADAGAIGAWKLRALVDGLLAVVTALVLSQRSQQAQAVHTRALDGTTAQGEQVRVRVDGRKVSSLVVRRIYAKCGGRWRWVAWTPSVGQGNVGLRETWSTFTVHEWPDPRFQQWPGYRQNLWMTGRLSWDAQRVEGTITYNETGPNGFCTSGPVSFSAYG